MPHFMDMHSGMLGLTPKQLAETHAKDLAVEAKYGVHYIKYFYDAATGKIFCFSEAPSKEAALAVLGEAHGNMPDDIFEVEEFE